jgi:TetR/AcrR family transcriptional regulator, transcriptional repressor for nem operon
MNTNTSVKHRTRKQQTHEHIVDTAAAIIRRTGYDGTGVADIMKEAGLTHGGFYAHFESRTQLLAEALDRATDESLGRMRRRLERDEPADALRKFIDSYLSDAHVAAPDTGCTLAALGTETPRQAIEVRDVAARRLKEMIGLVENQLPANCEPEDALGVLSCLVGALVLARAADDKRLSAAIRKSAKRLIDTRVERGAP